MKYKSKIIKVHEDTYNWLKNKKYDFKVDSLNAVIEKLKENLENKEVA